MMMRMKQVAKKVLVVALITSVTVSFGACNAQTKNQDANKTTDPSPTIAADSSTAQASSDQYKQVASDYVDAFFNKDYDKMLNDFPLTADMKKALNTTILASLTDQLDKAYGQVVQRKNNMLSNDSGYIVWSFGASYKEKVLAFNVVIDAEGNIAGFTYNEIENLDVLNNGENTGSTTTEEEWVSQFETKDVSFGLNAWTITGTITYPKGEGPFPAVVLVSGSGPQDRDETIGPNKPFRDLAEGLAAQGIASLRYDKRTLTHKLKYQNADIAAKLTIKDEVITDAQLAVLMMSNQDKIDGEKVFVVGHSLGANQAPNIALGKDKVAGLVMLAGNVTPLHEVMQDQVNYIANLDGSVSTEEQTQLDAINKAIEIMNGSSFSDKTPIADTLGVGYSYWKDLIKYDPTEVAKTLTIPMLVLQGERDYQVTMDEFAKWQKALGTKADFISYPNLNHLFMTGEGKATPQEYQVAGHVDQKVIEDLAKWINKQ